MSLSKLILLTHPEKLYTEVDLFRSLLELGIPCLHVRKELGTLEAHQNFLNIVPKSLRDSTLVHQFPELAQKYQLKGIHYKSTEEPTLTKGKIIGKSVHSFEEAEKYAHLDYLYLSPIFDSISKEGYTSNFDENELKAFLSNWKGKAKLYALGGINPTNAQKALDLGFYGVVVLGSIWHGVLFTKILDTWQQLKNITGES